MTTKTSQSKSEKMKAHWASGRMSKAMYTPEIRAKMSAIKKTHTPWNKGKVGIYSPEYRAKISASLRGKTGTESRNWKGGIAYYSVRATRKRENGGIHTKEEWESIKETYGGICPCCHEEKELVKDHIVPLAKGGSDDISNIQPLCRSCNAKKHTQIIFFKVDYPHFEY